MFAAPNLHAKGGGGAGRATPLGGVVPRWAGDIGAPVLVPPVAARPQSGHQQQQQSQQHPASGSRRANATHAASPLVATAAAPAAASASPAFDSSRFTSLTRGSIDVGAPLLVPPVAAQRAGREHFVVADAHRDAASALTSAGGSVGGRLPIAYQSQLAPAAYAPAPPRVSPAAQLASAVGLYAVDSGRVGARYGNDGGGGGAAAAPPAPLSVDALLETATTAASSALQSAAHPGHAHPQHGLPLRRAPHVLTQHSALSSTGSSLRPVSTPGAGFDHDGSAAAQAAAVQHHGAHEQNPRPQHRWMSGGAGRSAHAAAPGHREPSPTSPASSSLGAGHETLVLDLLKWARDLDGGTLP